MARGKDGENLIDAPEKIAQCLTCPLPKCICNRNGLCRRLGEVENDDGNQNSNSDMDCRDSVLDCDSQSGIESSDDECNPIDRRAWDGSVLELLRRWEDRKNRRQDK